MNNARDAKTGPAAMPFMMGLLINRRQQNWIVYGKPAANSDRLQMRYDPP